VSGGSRLDFPPSLQISFGFRSALADRAIARLLFAPDNPLSQSSRDAITFTSALPKAASVA
jgi:hypothetical protein